MEGSDGITHEVSIRRPPVTGHYHSHNFPPTLGGDEASPRVEQIALNGINESFACPNCPSGRGPADQLKCLRLAGGSAWLEDPRASGAAAHSRCDADVM